MALEFNVGSDLYCAGMADDGTDFIAERYHVTATDEVGNRWRYHKEWNGARREVDDEGYNHFADTRESAQKLAEAVCRTVAEDTFNPTHWHEARPVYGSDAWVVSGQDAIEIERERSEG